MDHLPDDPMDGLRQGNPVLTPLFVMASGNEDAFAHSASNRADPETVRHRRRARLARTTGMIFMSVQGLQTRLPDRV